VDDAWEGHMQIKECIAMEEVSGCMGGPHAGQRVHSHGGGERMHRRLDVLAAPVGDLAGQWPCLKLRTRDPPG